MKKLILFAFAFIFTGSLSAMNGSNQGINPMRQCFIAVKQGDAATVELLINEEGVDPNTQLGTEIVPYGYEDTTFLHWAIMHPGVLQLLLKKGALPNVQDEGGRTPLCQAACSLQPEVVKTLLENGADPCITDLTDNNPLHEITRIAGQGFLGVPLPNDERVSRTCHIIEMLKKYKAPLFLQNKTLNTPLHYAAEVNNPEVLYSLLKPATQENDAVEARARLFTLMCCLHRLGYIIANETKLQLLSHLPVECKDAQLESMIVPYCMSKETFMIRYLKEALPIQERNMLVQTLITPNIMHNTPVQIVTSVAGQQLLEPKMWDNSKE